MQPQLNKDILFYSNYCDFCKEVLRMVSKKNMQKIFLFVCVDENKFKLPKFVDKVPILYTKTKDVLHDDDILKYIERNSQSNTEISPFSIATGTGNYSDMFSFIENPDDESITKGYTYLGMNNHIMDIPEDPEVQSNKGKFDPSMFEKLKKMRADDMKQIFEHQQGYRGIRPNFSG